MNKILLIISVLSFTLFAHAESDLTYKISKAFDSCRLYDYSTLYAASDLQEAKGSQMIVSSRGTYVRNSSGGIVFLPLEGSKTLAGEEALIMFSKDIVSVVHNMIQKIPTPLSAKQAKEAYDQLSSACAGISTELDNAISKIKTLGQ
jgi:hypothetical protein